MDFDLEEWDVSSSASKLADNLFIKKRTKKLPGKKSQGQDQPILSPKLSLTSGDDSQSAKQKQKRKKNKPEIIENIKTDGDHSEGSVNKKQKKNTNEIKPPERTFNSEPINEIETPEPQSAIKKTKKSMKRKLDTDDAFTVNINKNKAAVPVVKKQKANAESKPVEKVNNKISETDNEKATGTPSEQSSKSGNKKNRKRKCKKNKFKDYSLEESNKPKVDARNGDEITSVGKDSNLKASDNQTPKTKVKKGKEALVDSRINHKLQKTTKSENSAKNKKAKGETPKSNTSKLTKTPVEKNSKVDSVGNKSKPITPNSTIGQVSMKKSPFDRKKLNAMLSGMKKTVKEVIDTSEDDSDSDADDDEDDDEDDSKTPKGNKGSTNAKDDENAKTSKGDKSKSLLEKSRERLNAARFRYLNEQLYTTTGKEAFGLFSRDREAFTVYHEGFQSQVEKWPTNPLDVIIKRIKELPKDLHVADLGCGDAKLSRSVPNKVHSFDLVALNDKVTVCEMSKIPLEANSVNIAVFCLSLMGTNLTSYLREAARILKIGGKMFIAEVSSRFSSIGQFVLQVESLGFKVKHQEDTKMFVLMEFKKVKQDKATDIEEITLKPCVYKKR